MCSNLVTIDVDIQPDSDGVLYALGGFFRRPHAVGGQGKLSYEYNLFELERTRIDVAEALPTGKLKIEVETRIGKTRGPLTSLFGSMAKK